MPDHAHRRVVERPERREVDRQRRLVGVHHGQLDMAVGAGAAVARHVLDDLAHAAGLEAVEQRAAKRRDLHRLVAERTLADHVVGALLPHVEHGQAVDVDPDVRERDRDRLAIGPRRLDRADRRLAIEVGEAAGGGKTGHSGGAEPRHLAALLVDQDRHVAAPGNLPQGVGEPPELRAVAAVAAEQDEAGRRGFANEGSFVIAEAEAAEAEDRREHETGLVALARSGKVRPGAGALFALHVLDRQPVLPRRYPTTAQSSPATWSRRHMPAASGAAGAQAIERAAARLDRNHRMPERREIAEAARQRPPRAGRPGRGREGAELDGRPAGHGAAAPTASADAQWALSEGGRRGCGAACGGRATGASATASVLIRPLGSAPALAAAAVSPSPVAFMPPGWSGRIL